MLPYQKQETVGCGRNIFICLFILNMDSILQKEYNKHASLLLLDASFILSDEKNIHSMYKCNEFLEQYNLFI